MEANPRMCIPMSPLQAIAGGGSTGRAVKTAMFPGAAMLGAFDKKKKSNSSAALPTANLGG